MQDLISRQAVLDAFNTNLNELVVGGEENAKTVENYLNRVLDKIKCLPPAQLGTNLAEVGTDCISRQAAIDTITAYPHGDVWNVENMENMVYEIKNLPSAQPDLGKYEYHYDHTDCIWYRPEARNRCPVTCSQYRDGWNDAMNYIFRDGKGYRPYKRGEEYGE